MKKFFTLAAFTLLAATNLCDARRKPRSKRHASRKKVAQQQQHQEAQAQQPQAVASTQPAKKQRNTQAILAAKAEGLLRYVREKGAISAGIHAEINKILSQLDGAQAQGLSEQFNILKSTYGVAEPARQRVAMQQRRPVTQPSSRVQDDQDTLSKKAHGLMNHIRQEGKISSAFANEIDRVLGQLQGPEKEKLMNEFNQLKKKLS